jgi:hypothetical protein
MATDRRALAPVGAVVGDLAAAAVGTLVMDLVLSARYRRGGGKTDCRDWELSAEVETWDRAPVPAQVGKRLVEGVFQREPPDRHAALVNNATRWGYGVLGGAQYGLVIGPMRAPRNSFGPPSARAPGYVVRPAGKLYRPIGSTTAKRWPTTSVPISYTGSRLSPSSPCSSREGTGEIAVD